MIAFRPVPPDAEEKLCSLCEREEAKVSTNSVWDRIIGRFSQLDEDDDGNILPDSELSQNQSMVSHFYCYLAYRPGNARIRSGCVDGKVALYSHAIQAWEVYLMTERELSPICVDCSRPIPESTRTTVDSIAWGGDVSTHFIHTHCVTTCQQCQKPSRESQIVEVGDDDNQWKGCRSCYSQAMRNDEFFDCTWCGRTLLNESLAWEDDRINTCYSCEDRVDTCDDCGTYYDNEGERHYHEVIQDYGTRPRPRFYPDDKQPYYLGYELEVEVDDDWDKYSIAEELLRNVNKSLTDNKYLYLKEDGSLDNGFEIVTHPFTLEYHQQFDLSFLERLTSCGVRSWERDTCGFHVHVSRSAFTSRVMGKRTSRYNKAHEMRFTSLFYLNRDKFIRFAGRQSNDYASFFSDDAPSVTSHILRKTKGHEDTRFQAVNIQNSNTIEVRIFRGSLKKERVLANLELVHACVEYTRNLNESVAKTFTSAQPDTALQWNRFRSWLVANEKFYPHVNQYLTDLSL